MARIFPCVFLVLSLVGCAKQAPLTSTPRLTVVGAEGTLPAPQRGDIVAPDRVALIGPLDQIAIAVFGIPELDGEMQVDAGGRITLPLVGTVIASGKTTSDLANEIAAGLRRHFVRNPQVAVNLKTSVSQVVAVDGQVIEPGLYPVTSQMTLMRAIASARGLSEYARQDDVVILRKVDGRQMAGLYNISAIRRGAYDDPSIFANDVIVVGDSPQRRLFKDIIGLAPVLAAPIIAIVQNF